MAIEDNPESRTAYGEDLRGRREAAGLTQEDLSQRAVMSRTHIAHIEAGRRRPTLDDARRLDQVLHTGGVFERYLPTLDGRKVAEHFEAAAGLEKLATMIREWAITLVPGLLQTQAYARAIFRVGFPPRSDEECDRDVVTRIERATILHGTVRPVLWALMDEGVLRRPIGGPAVMAEQLRHITDLADVGRIRLHVLPYGVGEHSLVVSPLTLMWFADLPPIAYVEGHRTGKVLDLPAVVQQCQAAYDQALGDALSHGASIALTKAVAKEYARDRH